MTLRVAGGHHLAGLLDHLRFRPLAAESGRLHQELVLGDPTSESLEAIEVVVPHNLLEGLELGVSNLRGLFFIQVDRRDVELVVTLVN